MLLISCIFKIHQNDGALQLVGALEVDFFEGTGGLDILPDSNYAMAVNNKNNESRLYTISLMSGKATWIGTFSQQIVEVAFKSKPMFMQLPLLTCYIEFIQFLGSSNSIALTGMNTNEQIVGLDLDQQMVHYMQ